MGNQIFECATRVCRYNVWINTARRIWTFKKYAKVKVSCIIVDNKYIDLVKSKTKINSNTWFSLKWPIFCTILVVFWGTLYIPHVVMKKNWKLVLSTKCKPSCWCKQNKTNGNFSNYLKLRNCQFSRFFKNDKWDNSFDTVWNVKLVFLFELNFIQGFCGTSIFKWQLI